jgi:hypothetical protein
VLEVVLEIVLNGAEICAGSCAESCAEIGWLSCDLFGTAARGEMKLMSWYPVRWALQ